MEYLCHSLLHCKIFSHFPLANIFKIKGSFYQRFFFLKDMQPLLRQITDQHIIFWTVKNILPSISSLLSVFHGYLLLHSYQISLTLWFWEAGGGEKLCTSSQERTEGLNITGADLQGFLFVLSLSSFFLKHRIAHWCLTSGLSLGAVSLHLKS